MATALTAEAIGAGMANDAMKHNSDGEIFECIEEILKSSGTVEPAVRDQLLLASIGALYRRVRSLEETVRPIAQKDRFITWAAAGLGGMLLLLLWQVLTNQATIVFP